MKAICFNPIKRMLTIGPNWLKILRSISSVTVGAKFPTKSVFNKTLISGGSEGNVAEGAMGEPLPTPSLVVDDDDEANGAVVAAPCVTEVAVGRECCGDCAA
jgi:hypothetical protein